MPLLNAVKIYRSDFVPLLRGEERLLWLGFYREPMLGVDSRMEPTYAEMTANEQDHFDRTGRRLPRSERFFQGFDWLNGVHVDGNWIYRVLFGVVGSGAVDSIAVRMWRVAKGDYSTNHWAVTSERLLLMKHESQTWEIMFEVPRSSVRSVRRRFKPLFGWGIVQVTFDDGSMIVNTAGMLDLVAARQLARALCTSL